MDTLIHWQWVTWLRLCASISTPTSEELVRRSWRPTSSLGVTWRCRPYARNDLFQENVICHRKFHDIVIDGSRFCCILTGTFCLKTRLGTSVGAIYALGGAGDVPLWVTCGCPNVPLVTIAGAA